MEEMEPVTMQVEPVEAKPESSHWYEVHISLEDVRTFIKANITTAARSFIAIGFYLKCVRDRGLFEEDNYQDVWDFAKSEYGISKSTASRYMSMNDRFSENGNSPTIKNEYRAFGKSQLQEMLYLEDEQLEQVKPGDRVEDIRNIRKPKEVPYIELPGQLDFEKDFPDILPPDQVEQLVISQKQTFEMNVMDMLSGEEQESIAISQQEPDQEQKTRPEQTPEFTIAPIGCPYRAAYSCTIPVENRTIQGDGSNCGSSCCWSCKFHGACKLECNASAGRDGEIPEYDAAWFVKEWGVRSLGNLKRALMVCRDNTSNAERAKAVQKELSPYGSYSHSCGTKYDFSFRSFAKGIDLRIGKVHTHLTYGRFVQELMNLYPNFEEPLSEEPVNVIEGSESVSEQEESVPESTENVIDGEYEEVPPEQELSARSILEEAKKTLKDWMSTFEGEVPKKWPPFIERQKIIVAALEAIAEEQEQLESESDPEPVKPEQPDLPILKNNDQRAAFIDAYETWPIWIETKETGERYYRYDLSEKAAIVVKVYWKHSWERYKESKDYEFGAQQYYLMGVKSEWRSGKNAYVEDESRTYYECSTNRSALVEYLKDFQKSK